MQPISYQRPAPHTGSTARYPRNSRYWRQQLPPERVAHLAGDELSEPGRLIHLFRSSYAGAQGRQWLQPHILWWLFKFLRTNGVQPDWDTFTSPAVAHSVTTLDLPRGHTNVHPVSQASMNFGLWWPIMGELALMEYRPWWSRWWPCRGLELPDAEQIDARAFRLGLRPWMSSATFEEVSGIARGLTYIHALDPRRRLCGDDIMVRILLPELLIVELYWLHAPSGRPRKAGNNDNDVVLYHQYDNALTKWSRGQYLSPLGHMYLRAGDILNHLTTGPEEPSDPLLQRIVELHRETRHAQGTSRTPAER